MRVQVVIDSGESNVCSRLGLPCQFDRVETEVFASVDANGHLQRDANVANFTQAFGDETVLLRNSPLGNSLFWSMTNVARLDNHKNSIQVKVLTVHSIRTKVCTFHGDVFIVHQNKTNKTMWWAIFLLFHCTAKVQTYNPETKGPFKCYVTQMGVGGCQIFHKKSVTMV